LLLVVLLLRLLPFSISTNKLALVLFAGTENDFQLDIANEGNRTIYKRIIDRAAAFGITHILFAPRNSDISCKRNNTDAWGWEQVRGANTV
jgi:hypothetical protein